MYGAASRPGVQVGARDRFVIHDEQAAIAVARVVFPVGGHAKEINLRNSTGIRCRFASLLFYSL